MDHEPPNRVTFRLTGVPETLQQLNTLKAALSRGIKWDHLPEDEAPSSYLDMLRERIYAGLCLPPEALGMPQPLTGQVMAQAQPDRHGPSPVEAILQGLPLQDETMTTTIVPEPELQDRLDQQMAKDLAARYGLGDVTTPPEPGGTPAYIRDAHLKTHYVYVAQNGETYYYHCPAGVTPPFGMGRAVPAVVPPPPAAVPPVSRGRSPRRKNAAARRQIAGLQPVPQAQSTVGLIVLPSFQTQELRLVEWRGDPALSEWQAELEVRSAYLRGEVNPWL